MDMLLLGLVPSIVLFIIVWRGDKIEKEPPKLLIKLFLLGLLTTFSALVIEVVSSDYIFGFLDHESLFYIFIDNFILTAMVEEGGKYFVLKKFTWKHPAFDHTFDAVVYAVVVSLGFATLENLLYLIDESYFLAIVRGVLAVPGHVIYAVYMGYYYGLAKYSDAIGAQQYTKPNLLKAFFVPVLLHGFYDFCLSTDNGFFILIFFVFEIVLTIFVIRKFRRISKADTAIPKV